MFSQATDFYKATKESFIQHFFLNSTRHSTNELDHQNISPFPEIVQCSVYSFDLDCLVHGLACHNFHLYNGVNATRAVIGRCP